MAEEQQNDQVDIERVEAFLQERMKSMFDKEMETRQLHVQQPPSQRTREQEAQELLRDTISPIVSPDINAARFDAANVGDKVDFYMANPDHLEYKDQVEAVFFEAQKNGRAMPRDAIYNYIIGKEYRADPVKFNAKQQAKHNKQLEYAQGAVDFGSGSMTKDKAEPLMEKLRGFDKLSADEMAEVLESSGITF